MLGFTELEVRTYLIVALCGLSIAVVNLLEQPYARSLVTCDTPVNRTAGAEFSGSLACGDRLRVIDVGAEISGKGQSLENFGRICITLFVSRYADRGRKNAAILGQFLIFASTVLFFVAAFLGTWGIPIYIIAQGLQGMSGIGILDEIITGDVALQSDDSVGVYTRKATFNNLVMLVCMPIIIYIQYAEFTDFTFVWLSIVLLNAGALALLVFVFPETLTKKLETSGKVTLFSEVDAELRGFYRLTTSNRLIKYRLLESLLHKLADWLPTICLPLLMAYFGYSQIKALFYAYLPGFIVGAITMELSPYLHKKYGYRRAFNYHYVFYIGFRIFFSLTTANTFLGVPSLVYFGWVMGPFAGWGALISALEIRLVGQEANAKYKAMMQLITFIAGTLTSYLYSALFDAEATTWFARSLPVLVSVIFWLVSIPVYVYGNGPEQLAECDKMTAEHQAEAAADSKKTD